MTQQATRKVVKVRKSECEGVANYWTATTYIQIQFKWSRDPGSILFFLSKKTDFPLQVFIQFVAKKDWRRKIVKCLCSVNRCAPNFMSEPRLCTTNQKPHRPLYCYGINMEFFGSQTPLKPVRWMKSSENKTRLFFFLIQMKFESLTRESENK